MAPFSASGNGEGFWGEVTSTLDWCEENYAVSAFLAEFWNTISNWLFLIPPAFGAFLSWKNKLERRYILSFITLFVVGIGSFCFHATLLYEMQLLDELPMIYCTCVMIFCISDCKSKVEYEYEKTFVSHGHQPEVECFLCWLVLAYQQSIQCSYRPRQLNTTLTLVLVVCCAMITLVYLTIVNPLIFQWAYGILVTVLVIGAFVACRKHRGSWKLLTVSLVSYGIGFIIWNIDNNFCSYVRETRNQLPPLLRPFLQLHAIWHTLAAIGSYYHILFSIDLRLRYLGRGPNLKLYREWLPFIYPAKEAVSSDILPTVTHNAAIFLLLFGLVIKLLK